MAKLTYTVTPRLERSPRLVLRQILTSPLVRPIKILIVGGRSNRGSYGMSELRSYELNKFSLF